MSTLEPAHETVNTVYQAESRRVLATLIRLLGDFDTAEEAMHDAFRAALEQWPRDGVPANPRAAGVAPGWLSDVQYRQLVRSAPAGAVFSMRSTAFGMNIW